MIGKVYADSGLEENRADRVLIEMGLITGEGLLGDVVDAVDVLIQAVANYVRYDGSEPYSSGLEEARMKVFAALKTIEEAA